MLFLAGLGEEGLSIAKVPARLEIAAPTSLPVYEQDVRGAKFDDDPVHPQAIRRGSSGQILTYVEQRRKQVADPKKVYLEKVRAHVQPIMDAMQRTPAKYRRQALKTALEIYRPGGADRVERMAYKLVAKGTRAALAFREALARELAATILTVGDEDLQPALVRVKTASRFDAPRLTPAPPLAAPSAMLGLGCTSCGGLGEARVRTGLEHYIIDRPESTTAQHAVTASAPPSDVDVLHPVSTAEQIRQHQEAIRRLRRPVGLQYSAATTRRITAARAVKIREHEEAIQRLRSTTSRALSSRARHAQEQQDAAAQRRAQHAATYAAAQREAARRVAQREATEAYRAKHGTSPKRVAWTGQPYFKVGEPTVALTRGGVQGGAMYGLGGYDHPTGSVWWNKDLTRLEKTIWFAMSAQAILSEPGLIPLTSTATWDGDRYPVLEYTIRKAVHHFRRQKVAGKKGAGLSTDTDDFLGSMYRGGNLLRRFSAMNPQSAEARKIRAGLVDILRSTLALLVKDWEQRNGKSWPGNRTLRGRPGNWRTPVPNDARNTLRIAVGKIGAAIGTARIPPTWEGWSVGQPSTSTLAQIGRAVGKVIDPITDVIGAVTGTATKIACSGAVGAGAGVIGAVRGDFDAGVKGAKKACGRVREVDDIVHGRDKPEGTPAPSSPMSVSAAPRPKPKPKPRPKPRRRPVARQAAPAYVAPTPFQPAAPAGLSTGVKVALGVSAVAVLGGLLLLLRKRPAPARANRLEHDRRVA